MPLVEQWSVHWWLRTYLAGRCNAFLKLGFCFFLTAEFHGLWDSLVYDVEVKSHVSCTFFTKGPYL